MTLPVNGIDRRFTDRSGKFSAGMTVDNVENNKKTISAFNIIDEDQDGRLSYEEMFHDLGRDKEECRHKKRSGTIVAALAIGWGIHRRSHFLMPLIAILEIRKVIKATINLNKLNEKCEEWKKLRDEMEAEQAKMNEKPEEMETQAVVEVPETSENTEVIEEPEECGGSEERENLDN